MATARERLLGLIAQTGGCPVPQDGCDYDCGDLCAIQQCIDELQAVPFTPTEQRVIEVTVDDPDGKLREQSDRIHRAVRDSLRESI